MLAGAGLLFVVTGGVEPTFERRGLLLALFSEGTSTLHGAAPGICPRVLGFIFYSRFLCFVIALWVGGHVSEGTENTFI